MTARNRFLEPKARAIAATLVFSGAILGAVGFLLAGSSSAADPALADVVADEVHSAIASNNDGRAYVIVRLEDPVVREKVTFDELLRRVHERQQEVLDAFAGGEFELTHRPPRAAGLSGRVNDAGLTRLAAHSLVRAVHLNPMRPPPAIESPAPSAAPASTLQNMTGQTAGGTAMGAGAGCDDCIALQPNPQVQNAVNWKASVEPDVGDPLTQSETPIAGEA